MARPGKHDALKPTAYECFDKGMKFSSICKLLPDVPEGTIKTWRRKWKADGGSSKAEEKTAKENAKRKASEPKAVKAEVVELEVIEGGKFRSSVTRLPTIDSPAFTIAEYTLKELALSGPEALRVQAARGLLDVVKIRAVIPIHSLAEESQSTLDNEYEDMNDLEPAELARLYREAL